MSGVHTDSLKQDIQKWIEESVFMPQEMKKRAKKILQRDIGTEKLQKFSKLIKEIIAKEDEFIKETLATDPLYFKNIKRKISREKLAEKLKNESQLQASELEKIEYELNNLMTY